MRTHLVVFLAVLSLAIGTSSWAQASAPAKYVDGVYTLDYQDAELGNVFIQVTVKNGLLADVSFPKGLGDVVIEDKDLGPWLKTLVAGPDFMTVDVVSGATQSCDLVRYAVQNVLKKAGGK